MKYYLTVFILIILHFVILMNIQFTAWPEMFAYPYLLNNDFKLYQDIVLPYEPLLPVILSWVYKVFGYNLLILKIFTWIIILISDLLIFFISFKVIGRKVLSLLPLCIYVIVQPLADGNLLWFDLATVPFILTALLIFFLDKKKKFFFLGLFLAFAFFIKQQIGLVLLFLIFYLIFSKQFKNLKQFIYGIVTPGVLIFSYVIFFSNAKDWFFWTNIVPVFWYPKFPGYTRWPEIFEMIKLLLLFGPPLYMATKYWKTSYHLRITTLIFFALLLTSFPRFEFFRIQQGIAVFVILIALLISINRVKIFFLIPGSILFALLSLNGTLRNVLLPARFYEPWQIENAATFKNYAKLDEKVYFLGLESSNYVITGLLPSKPWVDNFIWYMEIPGIQEKVVGGFKNTPPEVIFWRKPNPGNWYDLGTYQPGKIVEYIKLNYERIEALDEVEVWKRK